MNVYNVVKDIFNLWNKIVFPDFMDTLCVCVRVCAYVDKHSHIHILKRH